MAKYDWIGNVIFPISLVVIANVTLIGRVVWQKRHHRATWRSQRRLTISLLSISAIYMAGWLPMTYQGMLMLSTGAAVSEQVQFDNCVFLTFMICTILPFVTLTTLPELTGKFFIRRRGVVAPNMIT